MNAVTQKCPKQNRGRKVSNYHVYYAAPHGKAVRQMGEYDKSLWLKKVNFTRMD